MALSDVKVRSAKPINLLMVTAWYCWFTPTALNIGGCVIASVVKRRCWRWGEYPEVSLVDARARRDEARKLLANGVDPSENKKAVKVE